MVTMPWVRQVRDMRSVAPVDQTGRQVEQEIGDAGALARLLPARPQQFGQGLVELAADALDAGGAGEQRIEEGGAHQP